MKILRLLTWGALSLGLSFGTVACDDNDENKDYKAPASVLDVTAQEGFGYVTLKWKAPITDALYYYTKIAYADPVTGKMNWAYAGKFDAKSDGYTSKTISGFADENDVEFSFTTHGFSYGVSEAVTILSHVLAPVHNAVALTLSTTPDMLASIVSWENEYGVPVIVQATFKDIDGNSASVEIKSDKTDKMRIGSIARAEQEICVTVFDESHTNSAEPARFKVTPNEETPAQLSTTGWTIAECSSAWRDGQGDQWIPEHLIDGKLETAWHTNPSGGDNYPFHTVIDMQQPTIITSVDVYARLPIDQRDDPTKLRFQLSDDMLTWNDAGTFDFDGANPLPQPYNLIQANYGARYLKVILLEGPANYSYLGEVVPYGKQR